MIKIYLVHRPRFNSLHIMTEKERFADLFGPATPLKSTLQHEDFGKISKVPRYRHIAAQDARLPMPCPLSPVQMNLAEIPEHRFRLLCRNQLYVAREIDLHGWFVDEGIRFLQDNLEERNNYRYECWRVVYGKGRNSPHYDPAPLKQAALTLLLHHSAVSALAEIQDKDGQSGAVLIEVARRRLRK